MNNYFNYRNAENKGYNILYKQRILYIDRIKNKYDKGIFMNDMIDMIKNKIVELMPISKGKYHSQFVVKYDKDNMLRILFKYECFDNEILDFNEGTDKSIQQYFLDEIYNITKTNPEKSTKNISSIMKKNKDGEFDIVGLAVLSLTYNVVLSQRVTRPSMRTLLGLK